MASAKANAGRKASPELPPPPSKAAAKRLKQLTDEIPDDDTSRTLLYDLISQNDPAYDRSIVLIGSALLEHALEVAILSKMAPLSADDRKRLFKFDFNGPLATFDARIKVAHALGLFGPSTRDDLNNVRTVRNHFAHTPAILDFQNSEVAMICGSLNLRTTLGILAGGGETDPGRIFVNVVVALVSRLKSDMEGNFTNKFGTFSHRAFWLP